MNKRKLELIKSVYFAENRRKYPYIPLEYYELPQEVIAACEQNIQDAKVKAHPRKGRNRRGEVSLARRVRREVGM